MRKSMSQLLVNVIFKYDFKIVHVSWIDYRMVVYFRRMRKIFSYVFVGRNTRFLLDMIWKL